MLFNNAISAGVGIVPVVGDVLLAVYKANSRNAALLDEFLRVRGAEFLKIREAEERGENPAETTTTTAEDIKQLKPGTGMITSSERYKDSKDTGSSSHASSSPGVIAPTPVKSGGGLFGTGKRKEQHDADSKSGSKGRFVENMDV
jgi:Domain of unknown function (DUF4112)